MVNCRMRKMSIGIYTFLLLLSVYVTLIHCVGIEFFVPYGSNIDSRLDIGDDEVSEEITLNTPIVFYGERKFKIYVSTNGLVSFDKPIAVYGGELFPLGAPVIAPFYADVDTKMTGEVYYRETSSPLELEQISLTINKAFNLNESSQFDVKSAFVVTWSNVGSYDDSQIEQNTIQLIIATNSFESYAMFLYLTDGYKWTRAENTKPDIADIDAQAGFDSGNQGFPSYNMAGSGLPESADWSKKSNTHEPGMWAFKIGLVRGIEEPNPVTLPTTTDATSSSTSMCSNFKCHVDASCVDECCVCGTGTYGNGIGCLTANANLHRLTGALSGEVNGNSINDSNIQVSVVVDQSMTYTGFTQLPPLVGYPLQLTYPIGELMGWLFATGDSPNGFIITGAVLNYSATLSAGGEQLRIDLKMNGADQPLRLQIYGGLPTGLQGKSPSVRDRIADYAKISEGVYRSRSTHTYIIEQQSYEMQLSETIQFNECQGKAPTTNRVSHTGYNVMYNENNLITSFSVVSRTRSPESDVCFAHDCHYNADCNPKEDRFTCTCRQGYEGDGRSCYDLNECRNGDNTCSVNANCFNTDGAYLCKCQTGFSGDGVICVYEEDRISCRDLKCHYNAECSWRGEVPYCQCKTGFSGNGYTCDPIVRTCVDYPEICTDGSLCVFNALTSRYECRCPEEISSGDGGEICDVPIDASCAYCSFYADCEQSEAGYFHCVCQAGYTGNGRSCDLIETDGNAPIIPLPPTTPVAPSLPIATPPATPPASPPATPPTTPPTTPPAVKPTTPPTRRQEVTTRFTEVTTDAIARTTIGDGREDSGSGKDGSEGVDSNNCRYNRQLCDENASCQVQNDGTFKCVCSDGYLGTGRRCVRAFCRSHAECGDRDGVCEYSRDSNAYQCKTQQTTEPVQTCNSVSICSPDADCYDTVEGVQCVCRSGFRGDGKTCLKIIETCTTRPSMCDRNAVCNKDVCICNPGYRGDGNTCTALNEQGNYLLFSQGQSIFRVPYYQAGADRGERILYRRGQKLVGLAADCKSREFYFSDINTKTISKSLLENTTSSQVIVSGLSSPEGLAVDWVSRLLFFTDSGLNTIEVVSLDPIRSETEDLSERSVYRRKVIISENLENPRSIDIDSASGRIFWTDWGRSSPVIESSNMDGSDREIIVDSDLGLPNGLTYDVYRQELCWADAGMKRLECVSPDGSNRRVVFDYMSYPFSLTSFRDNFYWTDWQVASIQTIPRDGTVLGSSIAIPTGGYGKPYSIVSVLSTCLPVSNECSDPVYSCGEKLMCIPSGPGRASCECPDNIPEEQCNELKRL